MNKQLSSYKFAFTIVDDTDHATLANVKPLYDLLIALGLRTTKTVWPLPCDDPQNSFRNSATLQDSAYSAWVKELHATGFEIAFHGASAGSNLREKTEHGLNVFADTLGFLPTMHINHHKNRENLYWGAARINSFLVRTFVWLNEKRRKTSFEGHQPDSPYFWGDLAQQTIRYCRNLTFVNQIDVTTINPTIPYTDPQRSYVSRWFSSCDGGTPVRFVRLLNPANLEQLATQGGVCIVYTHFGAGFVQDGKVLPMVEEALRRVATLSHGLFVPASELLDRLYPSEKVAPPLPQAEQRRMERNWFLEKLRSGGTS